MPPEKSEPRSPDKAHDGLAYLFERFPSFSKTFCFREVLAVKNRGLDPLVYSLRHPKPDEPFQNFPDGLRESTRYLPEDWRTALKERIRAGKIPPRVRGLLAAWKLARWIPDRHRAIEAAWLGSVLREEGIHHIHAHFAGMASRVAWWVKKFYGISYSFTAHANDVFCDDIATPASRDKLFREALFVVTETDYSTRYLQDKFPFASEKIHRVYNGIDFTPFPKSNPDSHAPLVLSVGRYVPKKGFADLIDACALLKELPFRCLIVGGGPLEKELKERVEKNGLGDKVEICGPRSQSEILALLEKTTVFALPCVDAGDAGRDNLPTVIVEAMAASIPVVSTPIAGVPEMILEGETGYLVPQHDFRALADMIQHLLENRPLALSLGAKGRAHAEKNFALENTSEMLCSYWREYGVL